MLPKLMATHWKDGDRDLFNERVETLSKNQVEFTALLKDIFESTYTALPWSQDQKQWIVSLALHTSDATLLSIVRNTCDDCQKIILEYFLPEGSMDASRLPPMDASCALVVCETVLGAVPKDALEQQGFWSRFVERMQWKNLALTTRLALLRCEPRFLAIDASRRDNLVRCFDGATFMGKVEPVVALAKLVAEALPEPAARAEELDLILTADEVTMSHPLVPIVVHTWREDILPGALYRVNHELLGFPFTPRDWAMALPSVLFKLDQDAIIDTQPFEWVYDANTSRNANGSEYLERLQWLAHVVKDIKPPASTVPLQKFLQLPRYLKAGEIRNLWDQEVFNTMLELTAGEDAIALGSLASWAAYCNKPEAFDAVNAVRGDGISPFEVPRDLLYLASRGDLAQPSFVSTWLDRVPSTPWFTALPTARSSLTSDQQLFAALRNALNCQEWENEQVSKLLASVIETRSPLEC